MNTSFEEKSVWFQLVGVTAALGAYLVLAGRLLAGGSRDMAAFAWLFVGATAVLAVLLIVPHAVAAIASRPEGRDERDRLICWRAEHHSSWLVVVGVCGAVTCMALGVENVWTANLLLLSLALSEVLGLVLRLVSYRRGVR